MGGRAFSYGACQTLPHKDQLVPELAVCSPAIVPYKLELKYAILECMEGVSRSLRRRKRPHREQLCGNAPRPRRDPGPWHVRFLTPRLTRQFLGRIRDILLESSRATAQSLQAVVLVHLLHTTILLVSANARPG